MRLPRRFRDEDHELYEMEIERLEETVKAQQKDLMRLWANVDHLMRQNSILRAEIDRRRVIARKTA